VKWTPLVAWEGAQPLFLVKFQGKFKFVNDSKCVKELSLLQVLQGTAKHTSTFLAATGL